MSCKFNPEGRPKAEPNGSAECKLNWEAMGIIWDGMACLAKLTYIADTLCYTFGAVSEFDSFTIPKEDLNGAEITDCNFWFFKDGVRYGAQTDNPDLPLYITITEQITQYLIELSTPVGEADALSDIMVAVNLVKTFESAMTCDDLTCPE